MMLWALQYISKKDRFLSLLLCQMREDLRDGLSLSCALQNYHVFPKLIGKMIEVTESSGRLPGVLGMRPEFYQFQ